MDDEPLREAKQRGDEMLKELLAEALSEADVAERLGISVGEVDARRRGNQLIGIRPPAEVYYRYPAFQFVGGSTLPHLEEVLHGLRRCDALTQLGFFITSNGYLGDAVPADVLRHGDVEAVLEATKCYLEQGSA